MDAAERWGKTRVYRFRRASIDREAVVVALAIIGVLTLVAALFAALFFLPWLILAGIVGGAQWAPTALMMLVVSILGLVIALLTNWARHREADARAVRAAVLFEEHDDLAVQLRERRQAMLHNQVGEL
jgi:membrane protein implicated in regulation of membrane protease activity